MPLVGFRRTGDVLAQPPIDVGRGDGAPLRTGSFTITGAADAYTHLADRRLAVNGTGGTPTRPEARTGGTAEVVWDVPVEGYAAPLSVAQGESVVLRCSATRSPITIEVARVGAEREVVLRRSDIRVPYSPVPEEAWARGCDWPPVETIETDGSWRPGYYEVVLDAGADDDVSHAFFVVRPGPMSERSPMLLVLGTATYNAYNNWGGASLYEGGLGDRPLARGATAVSFARPMARGFLDRRDVPEGRAARVGEQADPDRAQYRAFVAAAGLSRWCHAGGWFNWERRFIRWAERAGYQIDLGTSLDLDRNPDLLAGYRLFLSVGHDEYWSWGMRDAVEEFIGHGGNAAFMSGNAVFWQVRFSDDGQTMVCHKYIAHETDPVVATDDARYMTGMWSDPIVARPENSLTGVTMNRGGYVRAGNGVPLGPGGYLVWRPEHWVMAGTELRYGDLLGASHTVVGFEADGCELTLQDGLPTPTNADGTPDTFEVIATSPAHLLSNTPGESDFTASVGLGSDDPGDLEFTALRLAGDASKQSREKFAHGQAVMGVYDRGGTVFTVGCTDWAYGLDGDWDPRLTAANTHVERITRNVLDRLGRP